MRRDVKISRTPQRQQRQLYDSTPRLLLSLRRISSDLTARNAPWPQPSLIRKWSSVVECNPGFFKESFESMKKEALVSPEKKDWYLIIDAMAIRKQTLWD